MKELNIAATVENIEVVTDFVNGQLEALDCPMKAQMQIDIAIDELFGNIAHYAYNPEVGDADERDLRAASDERGPQGAPLGLPYALQDLPPIR